MSQLVFLTFFLGLVTGPQTVSLNASPDIRTVAILLDEQKVATLERPFTGSIDLGKRLAPRLLVAVGYDEKGNELGRTSQVLNVPHPPAEASIVLSDGNRHAEVHWMQRVHEKPSQVLLTVDDKPVPLDAAFGAALPPLDPAKPHVIAADVRFHTGAVARREVIIAGGAYSDAVDTEITPVVVHGAAQPEKLSGCFDVRVSAVEKSKAIVVFVKDPDALPIVRNFARQYRTQPSNILAYAPRFSLDRGTTENILWPIMQPRTREGNPTLDVFESNTGIDAFLNGMVWTLTRGTNSREPDAPRQYAKAVAVAGMMAAEQGTRRAVVLVLQPNHDDQSTMDPANVREYLRSIDVPLYVWSIGATPEQREAWGEVTDVATNAWLSAATNRLKEDLASQTVVWLATDAWHALRAASSCH